MDTQSGFINGLLDDHVPSPALEERDHVFHGPAIEQVDPFGRHIGAMGREHDLLTRQQWVIARNGLLVIDVYTGTAKMS